MPKPYKLTRPYPLPSDPEIVDLDDRPHVRVKVRGKFMLCRVSKDGTKCLQPSKRWYFDVRDANGTVHRVKGFADLKATEQLAAETDRKASRVRSGFTDPAEEHVRRPLTEHLKDYGAYLESKGGTLKHVRDTVARCSAMFAGCGFVFPADSDAGKAAEWLVRQRRDSPPRGSSRRRCLHAGRRCEAARYHEIGAGSNAPPSQAGRKRERQGPPPSSWHC